MTDYLLVIVGAGPQGLSIYLNLPPLLREKTLVIDAEPVPMQNFYRQAENVGMKYLRSPASHCLKEPLVSLLSFARKNNLMSHFNGRYLTPSLVLLQKYMQFLLEKNNLASHFMQCRMHGMRFSHETWHIDTSRGTLSAKNCILALGMGRISFPPSIQSYRNSSADKTLHKELILKHVLHPFFFLPPIHKKKIAIIGGGMSGSQVALRTAKLARLRLSASSITLFSKTSRHVQFFDSEPGYIGPKYRGFFLQEKNYSERRSILQRARNPGSINPYVQKKLNAAMQNGELRVTDARVNALSLNEKSGKAKYSLQLNGGSWEHYDDIILATGFGSASPPHITLLQQLHENHGCSVDANYWPIPNAKLMWHKGLYLIGALAELELGPPARNIIGAHLAFRTLRRFWNEW